MTVKKTLAELVAIDSVSARSNGPVIDYLAARCAAIGFSVQRFPYTDARRRENKLVGDRWCGRY